MHIPKSIRKRLSRNCALLHEVADSPEDHLRITVTSLVCLEDLYGFLNEKRYGFYTQAFGRREVAHLVLVLRRFNNCDRFFRDGFLGWYAHWMGSLDVDEEYCRDFASEIWFAWQYIRTRSASVSIQQLLHKTQSGEIELE